MNKTTKYALNGALWIGLGNALLNALKQWNQMDNDPSKKFDWGELLIAGGKGAVVGGLGGMAIGAIADHQNSLEKPLNTDAILLTLVDSLKLDKNASAFQKLDAKATELAELLKQEFGSKLANDPMRLGSTEKGTALNDKYDIDICLPFKSKSFATIEDMYYAVLDFLNLNIGKLSIVGIRDQKKSVGVIMDIRGKEYKIDVVPYKKTKGKRSGYLYKNDRTFWSDNSSYTKTDIYALNNVKLTETQKKIVIILKGWKKKNNLPLSSYLLENLVLDAYKYNQGSIPRSFTKKVIMVWDHIATNLDVAVIRGVENTNNVLTDIPESDKSIIISACKKAVEEYEYQPNAIIEALE